MFIKLDTKHEFFASACISTQDIPCKKVHCSFKHQYALLELVSKSSIYLMVCYQRASYVIQKNLCNLILTTPYFMFGKLVFLFHSFVTFCLLPVTFFLFFFTFWSLVVTFSSLLANFCLLFVRFCLLHVIFCLLFATFCPLILTFWSLLAHKFFTFFAFESA